MSMSRPTPAPGLTRRRMLQGSGAITAAVLAGAPRLIHAQSATPELQTLRSTSKSWLWAAEDYATWGGFFEQAGVRVVSNASNRGTNVAALQGGGVDVVLGDPGEASRARAQNLPIRMFISTVNRYASHVVVKKEALDRAGVDQTSPDMDRAKALKGLRLGTTGPGAAPDALFRFLADMAGLDPNADMTLTPVQGGGAGMIAGLQQGALDGFCLSSPTSDIAIQTQGCAYLFQMVQNPPEYLKEYQYIIASSAERTIGDKRDALVRYAKGIALALRSIATEPEKVSAWAAEWFAGIDPAIFDTVVENNRGIYFEDPTPRRDLYEKNIAFITSVNRMMGADTLPESLTFDTMVDPTIAAEAVQSL